jgi:histidine ammonia-lyase
MALDQVWTDRSSPHGGAALNGSTPPGRRGVTVGVGPLDPLDVVFVARDGAGVQLGDDALAAMAESREVIDDLAGDDVAHYGISTGFGALATKKIPPRRRVQLQRSLVRSHAAGTGPEVEREVVRALMLLRLSTLATGRTGVRPSTALAYAAMLGAGITPVVHEYGSLGCSGDLAPLAHVALALMGEGEVRDADGVRRPAADALAAAGLAPVELAEKEGLALVNGTDGMLGMLVLALHDLRLLLTTADLAAALSVEALLGTTAVFAADLQALRPHPGQAASAANLRTLLHRSEIVAAQHGKDSDGKDSDGKDSDGKDSDGKDIPFTRVQDAYSLRCAPQVHGAARDTLDHAAAVAGRELSAAVDNPVVTVDGRVESNGNFHGAPVGYVLDFLAIAVADVAGMSERRTDRFMDVARNHGLPPFLADDPGVDSGLMIAQYTAAGIVSELKRLAAPASVDSIPSSAMQEDHVSMGWAAARKLRRALDGLSRVLAIEILTASRAIELRAPLRPAPATGAALAAVRALGVGGPGPDRYLAPDIEAVADAVRAGSLVDAAQAAAGRPLS